MKKISHYATLAVLIASFGVPLLASATVGAGQTCVSGIECNSGVCSGGFCIGGGTNPIITSAPGGINTSVITPYSEGIKNVINKILVPVLFAIAFIVFLWGVYKYFILGAADEKSRTDGRQFVLWGIIGFVVILGVWGLVSIVSSAFGLQMGGAAPRTPTL